ncbi:hypothetical protein ACFYW9_30525 [Streptomyces sp. NPDC002698]|uniref:hypothetical protein n=1 Tax=Streptomyces sp. NPDC002698 TaxID=3364660 RepID=UPI003680363B
MERERGEPGRPRREHVTAAEFADTRLPGTFGATLLVHPRTGRAHRTAVNEAVAALRYGTVP